MQVSEWLGRASELARLRASEYNEYVVAIVFCICFVFIRFIISLVIRISSHFLPLFFDYCCYFNSFVVFLSFCKLALKNLKTYFSLSLTHTTRRNTNSQASSK